MIDAIAENYRREALGAALAINPNGTSEQVLRDAERFYAYLRGEQDNGQPEKKAA